MEIEKVLAPMRAEHAHIVHQLKHGRHALSSAEISKLNDRRQHLHTTLRVNEEFIRKQLSKEKVHG